jgi:sterol 14-demethylase
MSAAETNASTAGGPSGSGKPPLRLSGGLPFLGHLLQMRRAPIELMQRCHDECSEIGELNLAGNPVVMLYGEAAQEAFFRAPDEQLDQAAAYPFMKPVFGSGVVFDATPEQRKQALRNQSLKDQFMRGHAEVIAAETERALASWGEVGEIDLLDFFAELTIYTSSACLIGREFREELTADLVPIFKDLERGTDAFAYVNPYLPIPSFWKRDRARKQLVGILAGIFERREAAGRESRDLFHALRRLRNEDGSPRYSVDQITGMFISMMFAGHHTTSTTSSWMLLELLLHPEWMERVTKELDAFTADGREVSYQALREIPELECAFKETLRLHPPLIILMRKVQSDFHPGREEDKRGFAWLPFGAGRHRCVGAPFAMMQLKAIFSILLRRYQFELAQPRASYRNDHSKMVVQLQQPCRVRYRRRGVSSASAGRRETAEARASGGPVRVAVDRDLCQGHAVCVSEAPELFAIDAETNQVRVLRAEAGPELREKLEKAVRYCPTRALSIEKD